VLLVIARLISAAANIIHDCDETYNYLEPLHFLLFGSGMQTWEYSSQYALRSYLYLLLHATLLFLCVSSGMFAAATSMLPSTFTMYALTAAAAGVLQGRPYAVIAAAVTGEPSRLPSVFAVLCWMPKKSIVVSFFLLK
jgi:alpha-1,2-mannosyltransferase